MNQNIETTATRNEDDNLLNKHNDASKLDGIDELAQEITIDHSYYVNPPRKIVKSMSIHSTNNHIVDDCNDDDVDELTLLITIYD